MARAGLKKVIKTVRGQSGKTFKRSYQVRTTMAGHKPDPRFNDAWKKTKKGGMNGWPKKVGRKGFDDAMRIAKRKKKWGIFNHQPSQGSENAASGVQYRKAATLGGVVGLVQGFVGTAGVLRASTAAISAGYSARRHAGRGVWNRVKAGATNYAGHLVGATIGDTVRGIMFDQHSEF